MQVIKQVIMGSGDTQTIKMVVRSNERGPQGFRGERGTQGPQGIPGPRGADGAIQYRAGMGISISPDNIIRATGSAIATWGGIEGNITDQTDLETALNNKQDTLSVAEDTGLNLIENTISGVPATNSTIGMVKPGAGLKVDSSGTISADGVTFVFDTVSDMEASTALTSGDYIRTLGYYAKNDGGGAYYKVSSTQPSGYYENLSNLLYAELIASDSVNVDQLGAHGDGQTDDTNIVQTAINNFDKICFSKKTYLCKGITVLSNKTLIGSSTVLKGDNSTDGIKCYNSSSDTIISNVYIKNIELTNYATGLNTVNCRRSIFDNVNCNHCNVGASFMGGTWINKFYSCKFNDNTSDGFKTGLEITHPITSETLTVSNTEFDFFSCEFGGNGGYGVNGRLHVYNFFGGFTDGNVLGGVRMYSFTSTGGSRLITYGVSFIGFDAEQLDQAYIFEGDTKVEFSHVYIIGGQISLDRNVGRVRSAIVLKGPSCVFQDANNLVVRTRLTQGGEGVEPYCIYADNISGASVQADFVFANFNTAYINTNLNMILNNGVVKVAGNLPLEIFGGDYFGNQKITIPNNSSITLNIGGLTYLSDLNLTTDSPSSIRFYGGGRPVSDYVQKSSGVINSVVEDGENVVKWHSASKTSYVRIKNVTGTDVAISNIYINGLAIKNQ